jgi:Zn-dependent protease
VQALDLNGFLKNLSIYAIPILYAITLHEVAHGWMARQCGDRTAELLGRLSLNPLRHIDPVGTLLIPGTLLVLGLPAFGWAKPVPVAVSQLPNPRRAMILVALAGPGANFLMAIFWSAVLAVVLRINDIEPFSSWIILMAQAGILSNVVIAVFNLLPIPPLDGGRVLTSLLPPRLGIPLERLAPIGMFIVFGLSVFHMFDWWFNPAFRVVGRLISALWVGPAA